MESPRLQKIQETMDGLVQYAMKEHYSGPAVAQGVAGVAAAVNSVLEEMDELIRRVDALEERIPPEEG